MAVMPDFSRDLGPVEGFARREWREARDTMRHLMHHGAPHPAAQPPAPHIAHNGTQEAPPMSFITELENDAKALAAKFEAVDHEALGILDAVQANPATAEGLAILAQLTHLAPETLAVPLSMLRGALQALGGQAPASISGDAQPAGPQVAGQA
jgi:hypothetical protein